MHEIDVTRRHRLEPVDRARRAARRGERHACRAAPAPVAARGEPRAAPPARAARRSVARAHAGRHATDAARDRAASDGARGARGGRGRAAGGADVRSRARGAHVRDRDPRSGRALFVIACAALLVTRLSAADSPREHLSLDANWKFHSATYWPDALHLENSGTGSGPASEKFSDLNDPGPGPGDAAALPIAAGVARTAEQPAAFRSRASKAGPCSPATGRAFKHGSHRNRHDGAADQRQRDGGDLHKSWYLLTPSPPAAMSTVRGRTSRTRGPTRLYFGSNVMQNGNVFVLGGEYIGGSIRS